MLAVLAALVLAATPEHDTVLTEEGGRVVGTVVELSVSDARHHALAGDRRRPRRWRVRSPWRWAGASPSAPPAPVRDSARQRSCDSAERATPGTNRFPGDREA